jgi:hypothetical protein
MAYIGTTPLDVRSFGTVKFEFTATAGQTAFTGSDDNGKTLGFTEGQIEVYVNGVLMDSDDFTTSGGNTVTLGSAAAADDIITVNTLKSNAPITDYVQTTGGTFSGDVTVEGAFTSQGIDDNATSTAMTLDSSGKLLVGKSSNSFSTAGVEADAANGLFSTRNGFAPLSLNRLSSDGDIANFYKDGTTVGSIKSRSSGGNLQIDTVQSGIDFAGDGYLPMRNGSITDNSLDMGSSSFRYKDLYLSGGVYLGGTGSANKLDDYEEGSFTSTITYDDPTDYSPSQSATMTAYYVKVGNVCHVSWSRISNANGGLQLGQKYVSKASLPFTSSSNGTSIGNVNVYLCRGRYSTNTSNEAHFYTSVGASSSLMNVQGNHPNYGGGWIELMQWNSSMVFSITYQTS